MPGPHIHLASGVVAATIGHKWLNSATVISGVIIPDVMPIFVGAFAPVKGVALNSIYTFFDQTLIGGVIDIAVLSSIVIILMKKFPRLMSSFIYKQNHSKKVIIISAAIGVLLHIAFDVYLFQ